MGLGEAGAEAPLPRWKHKGYPTLVGVDPRPRCLVRYFAAAKAAAGVGEDRVEATTLAEALAAVRSLHGPRFEEVLARCSYLVDGHPAGTRDHGSVAVPPGSVVDCLPPFAGG